MPAPRRYSLLPVLLVATTAGGCRVTWQDAELQRRTVDRYVDAHLAELGTGFVAPLSRTDFLARLRQTRVLYIGDHHRDTRLHAEVLELLDWLCDQGLRPVLGLEAIGSEDNPGLQEYLTGGIDLAELRHRIARRWPQSWLERDDVDRRFFRALLQRARSRHLDAFPLEPTPRLPLDRRDGVIATNVKRALRLYPDRLVVVVVGHAHILGDGHLLGRVGAPSMTIAARCSPALARALARARATDPDGFLRTDRGVLFFPAIASEQLADQ